MEKKSAGNIEPLMMMLDMDHDGMLNVSELKALLEMSGAPPSQADMLLGMLMGFDADKNQKLDKTGKQIILFLLQLLFTF